MGRTLTHMTMSLDGFVATDADDVGSLFDWYGAGPVELGTANPDIGFRLDEASAAMMRDLLGGIGALVCGRHLFDITDGWGDRHPVGAPVVVVTHAPPADTSRWARTTFTADVPAALETARRIAGDRDVVIASPTIAAQALDLGLLDEIAVSLAPVLLGGGKPFFGGLATAPVLLEDPVVVQGTRATHLRYAVRRQVVR